MEYWYKDALNPKSLWKPSNPEATPISIYRHHINKKFNQSLKNSQDLHKWSVQHPHDFWIDLWDYVGLTPALPPNLTKAYDDSKSIRDIPKFFEGVRMNYAENVLSNRDPNAVALIGLREGESLDGEVWTWAKLTEHVRKTTSALLRSGIKQGDRIAAFMSNSPWTIAIFLAVASIGGVFTSISPEMGAEGVVSRLDQIAPGVLFVDSHQTYKGKRRPMREKIDEILGRLGRKPKVVIVTLVDEKFPFSTLDEFLQKSSPEDCLGYLRVPFSEPLVILYSSGTTGTPKCLVHQHGVILNLKKISKLHNSLTSNDVVFQYSSTSWVMWNIMNGHLACGVTLICYDGSPLYPDASMKLRIAERHKATWLGTSPRYLLELEMSGIKTSQFDLGSLRVVTTTGSTLTPDQFRWFYRAFPKRIHLSSVAGGTEICTSWLASDPAGPVYVGEMQIPALGHDIDAVDPDTGDSVKLKGDAGELICRSPFPSMPVYFWNDPSNAKYNEAYFERFTTITVWAQHDWIQFNPKTGGAQIHGRSDGTLNPSGIRFGSSEIYALIESAAFHEKILDTLCVGRKRPSDRDEVVFLFIKMKEGEKLTDGLRGQIIDTIKRGLSPRHIPRFIVQITDIPVTINGKKVEIAVKKIISGMDVKASSTVANPECLEEYVKYRALEEKKMAKL